MNMLKQHKKAVIMISLILLILIGSHIYMYRFKSVSQIVSFDNVQSVGIFICGKTYEFTGQQAQTILDRVDELPMSKCRIISVDRASPPGEQYSIVLWYEDGTRASVVFASNNSGSCIIEFYGTDKPKKRAIGYIPDEYVALGKYTHELVGEEWLWK